MVEAYLEMEKSPLEREGSSEDLITEKVCISERVGVGEESMRRE